MKASETMKRLNDIIEESIIMQPDHEVLEELKDNPRPEFQKHLDYIKQLNSEQEIWKPITIGGMDYTGIYEVSNKGRIRSLDRLIKNKGKYMSKIKGRLFKPSCNNKGYPRVLLRKDNKPKMYLVSRLVVSAFEGEIPNGCVVHHDDENPLNNNLSNLKIKTFRGNLSIEQTAKSGLPVGVVKSKSNFIAKIDYNYKRFYLGSYKTPKRAAKAYQIALELIKTKDNLITPEIIRAAIIAYKKSIRSKSFIKIKKI